MSAMHNMGGVMDPYGTIMVPIRKEQEMVEKTKRVKKGKRIPKTQAELVALMLKRIEEMKADVARV